MKNKDYVMRLIRQADELLFLNEYNKAELLLNEVIKYEDQNPEIYYLLGEVYCKQRKFNKSIVMLRKSLILLPGNPQVLHLLGWATFMHGDVKKGRKLLKQALKQLPRDVSTLCDLAVLENQQQNEKEAKNYALRAQEIDHNNPLVQEVFRTVLYFGNLRSKLKRKIN